MGWGWGGGVWKGVNSPKETPESSKTAELRGNNVNKLKATPERSGPVLKEKNPKGSSKVTQSDWDYVPDNLRRSKAVKLNLPKERAPKGKSAQQVKNKSQADKGKVNQPKNSQVSQAERHKGKWTAKRTSSRRWACDGRRAFRR